MKKHFAICIVAAAAINASPALAQSATFQAQETSNQTVGGTRTDGTVFGGQSTTGTTVTVWADGKKTNATYKCMGVSMPPNDSTYNFRLVCDSDGAEGSSSTIWGCTTPDKVTKETNCTGWTFGKSGIYAGRRGTMTYLGADGKGSGTVLWGK